MSLLFGRPIPAPLSSWRTADLEKITAHVEGTRLAETAISELRARVDAKVQTFAASEADFATIGPRLHTGHHHRDPTQIPDHGANLYPTYRNLLFETDRQERRWDYCRFRGQF